MRVRRFSIWLACLMLGTFAVSSTAFAQTRREREVKTRPDRDKMTPREKERAREARETAREKARDRRVHKRDVRAQRRQAEAAWREAVLRRERALHARRMQERRDLATWRRMRAARAEARRREIYAKWYWAVRTPEGRAEFELYSSRMARLNRIRDIAEDKKDTAMLVRVNRVVELENARHANVLAVLVAKRG